MNKFIVTELTETIDITVSDLEGNIKYVLQLIDKLKVDLSLATNCIERAAKMCFGEVQEIAKTNQQLINILNGKETDNECK